MIITTNELKSGLFHARAYSDGLSTSCTHKDKVIAQKRAAKGIKEMIHLIKHKDSISLEKISLFGVSVREKNARKIGVDAVEADGRVKRQNIGNAPIFN